MSNKIKLKIRGHIVCIFFILCLSLSTMVIDTLFPTFDFIEGIIVGAYLALFYGLVINKYKDQIVAAICGEIK